MQKYFLILLSILLMSVTGTPTLAAGENSSQADSGNSFSLDDMPDIDEEENVADDNAESSLDEADDNNAEASLDETSGENKENVKTENSEQKTDDKNAPDDKNEKTSKGKILKEEPEKTEPEKTDIKPAEEIPNPSNFSADFMSSLYQCAKAKEQQNISGFEEIEILGSHNGKCKLKYDDFVLEVPTELLPNIHSMTDIRQLLQNRDITSYKPQYEYAGLLKELNVCDKSSELHSAYLHRQTSNDVTITKGLVSKLENDGCTIRLLNQLNIGDSFADYSVICKIPAKDMFLILDAYNDLLVQDNPAEDELQKADAEIMFRLQQVGYCQKPKL